jgi:hypothetical protein
MGTRVMRVMRGVGVQSDYRLPAIYSGVAIVARPVWQLAVGRFGQHGYDEAAVPWRAEWRHAAPVHAPGIRTARPATCPLLH